MDDDRPCDTDTDTDTRAHGDTDTDADTLCSIGELARRTGLPVKTIRFYSDSGVVTPADRTTGGYRLYGVDAVARLGLVRTLRELGLDLATIRRVVDREIPLAEVASAHAEALDVQIHTLRQRRAVLTVAAKRGSTPEELDLMHRLTKLSEDERRRLVCDFLGSVFTGLHTDPAFPAVIRSMTPELPADPTPQQVEAWVELAELFQDADFRSSVRGMARNMAADRARPRTTPRGCPASSPKPSAHSSGPRWPRVSIPPGPGRTRSSRRSPGTTRTPSGCRTATRCAGGWPGTWRA